MAEGLDPEGGPRVVAGDLVRDLAGRHGDRPLAVLGDRTLTYADAERQSAALAKGLLASGVGKGSRVGLLAPNGPEWIVTWLAGSRIGAVVTLLNTYAPPRELGWALRHSDTAVLVAAAEHLGHDYVERLRLTVDGLADQRHEHIRTPSHPFLRSVWFLAENGQPWAGPVDQLTARGADIDDDLLLAAEAEVTPADPMVVVYSSGSTAEPKGAVHTHGAVWRQGRTLSDFRPLAPGDRVYTPMPFFWVGGFGFALVRALRAGATLVLEERFEPGATLALLERERVTHVLGWPHMGPALTGHPDFPRRDLSALRGGALVDLLPPDRRPADPGLVAGSLGMTETLGPHLIDHEGAELKEDQRGSFGRPVPGMEHRVVDGELWVRGGSVMAGLHKRERDHVFTPDGWYRTGDAGHFDDDGHFFFTGRMGDLVKSSGMNISPREVEVALEAEPEVTRAVVVGIPAGPRGEDVAAAVVARDVTAADLTARLRATLSSYKVPRHLVVLADDDELPWLDSGKVDRRALAERLSGAGGPAGPAS
ncbi:MAG TPA: class I adenylate-forming enzyme family protein [Acidimicrobiales bacterium]|nr:class I adenylate-forming enzyme family protein [Acidimicrobiales bacterium]